MAGQSWALVSLQQRSERRKLRGCGGLDQEKQIPPRNYDVCSRQSNSRQLSELLTADFSFQLQIKALSIKLSDAKVTN